MTDKQIIIDGVPVQDCCYFDYENNGYEDSCYIHQNECSAQNCYYKQLKRKEQECETLASQLDFEVQKKECLEQECEELRKQYNCYACDTCKGKEDYINLKRHCENAINSLNNKQAELDQLKAENDELKKIIERLDVPKHEVIDMDIALENEKLKAENEKLDTENKRLVAELANPVFDSFEELDKLKQTLAEIKEIAETCSFTDNIQLLLNRFEQILQKISECEVENGNKQAN